MVRSADLKVNKLNGSRTNTVAFWRARVKLAKNENDWLLIFVFKLVLSHRFREWETELNTKFIVWVNGISPSSLVQKKRMLKFSYKLYWLTFEWVIIKIINRKYAPQKTAHYLNWILWRHYLRHPKCTTYLSYLPLGRFTITRLHQDWPQLRRRLLHRSTNYWTLTHK